MQCSLNTNYSKVSFGYINMSDDAVKFVHEKFTPKDKIILNGMITGQSGNSVKIDVDAQGMDFLYAQIKDINYWTGRRWFESKTAFIKRACKKANHLKEHPFIFNVDCENRISVTPQLKK